jgi:hypothetical protein
MCSFRYQLWAKGYPADLFDWLATALLAELAIFALVIVILTIYENVK